MVVELSFILFKHTCSYSIELSYLPYRNTLCPPCRNNFLKEKWKDPSKDRPVGEKILEKKPQLISELGTY